MAVASLRYRPNAINPEENKLGYVIYSGSAVDFQYWKFRTELKIACCKDDDDYRKVAQNVIETLRGDPLQVAMDIGIVALISRSSNGLTTLVQKIQDKIFPLKDEEAKALYREGHKIGGVVSRQSGESMSSYITRRERWYKLLTSMDSSITFSDHMLGDMLLDNAGLNETQRLLILTSISNVKTFDGIAEALKLQHSKIQFLGSRSSTATGRDGKNRGGKGYGHKKWRPHAHVTEAAPVEEEEEDWDHGHENSENAQEDDQIDDQIDHYDGDVDQHDIQGEEVDDEILAMELYTLTELGDEQLTVDEDVAAELAQSETMNNMAWIAVGKGKGRKGRGKGGKRRFPTGRSNLSLEERRRKLKALKARTSCGACGEKGHWAGDPQCSKSKGAGAGKGSDSKKSPGRPKGFMVITGNDSDHGTGAQQYYIGDDDEADQGPNKDVDTLSNRSCASEEEDESRAYCVSVPGHHWEKCWFCERKTLNFGICDICERRPCSRWCELRTGIGNFCPAHWPDDEVADSETVNIPMAFASQTSDADELDYATPRGEFEVVNASSSSSPRTLGARPKPQPKGKSSSRPSQENISQVAGYPSWVSVADLAWETNANHVFSHGPYKGETYKAVADMTSATALRWIDMINKGKDLPKYQQNFKNWLELYSDHRGARGPIIHDQTVGMTCPECGTSGIDKTRKVKGSTAYSDRLECDNCDHKLSVPHTDQMFLTPDTCP